MAFSLFRLAMAGAGLLRQSVPIQRSSRPLDAPATGSRGLPVPVGCQNEVETAGIEQRQDDEKNVSLRRVGAFAQPVVQFASAVGIMNREMKRPLSRAPLG